MTWNYRVVKKTYMGEALLGIHEVYYTDGNPEMVTVDPVGITGDDMAELRAELAHYTEAFSKPVLNYEEIPSAN